MSPRKRNNDREHWPKNMYSDGRGHFYYKSKMMKAKVMLPGNVHEAIEFSRSANLNLLNNPSLPKFHEQINKGAGNDRVNSGRIHSKTIADIIPEFVEYETSKTKSSKSTSVIKCDANAIKSAPFSNKIPDAITVSDLSPWLHSQTKHRHIKLRSRLISLFDYCLGKGYRRVELSNPAKATLKIPKPPRKRKRLSFRDFKLIYEAGTPELKLTMHLMILTTLRTCDVVSLRRDAFIPSSNTEPALLRTKIQKSDKLGAEEYTKYLEIELGPNEEEFIRKTMDEGPESPYLVKRHHKPRGPKSKTSRHWSQLTVESIGEQFNEVASRCGLFKELPPGVRPTLYECRSLSAHLQKKMGRSKEEIQALLAHTDAKTTEIYLGGHEPQYTRVRALMDFTQFDKL